MTDPDFGARRNGPKVSGCLILLDANPLTDIRNVREQSGVMVRGRWLSNEDLQTMLDQLAGFVLF